MCCEQLECYVAVFDHAEAVCYLKGETAMNTASFVSETGFTTFEMFFRGGPVAGTRVVLYCRSLLSRVLVVSLRDSKHTAFLAEEPYRITNRRRSSYPKDVCSYLRPT